MKKTIAEIVKKQQRPIKIVQFGEGNFLRAFVDWMVDILNEKTDFDGSIVMVKPTTRNTSQVMERFGRQDCLYTVVLRGIENGEVVNTSRVITAVEHVVDGAGTWEPLSELAKCPTVRFVVSNTTDAGIVLDEGDTLDGVPGTYPGKLTKFLYERFVHFDGSAEAGLVILPVELNENNGGKLRHCVISLAKIWNLPKAFQQWITQHCKFCSTLVDRIVTGYPAEEAEHLWDSLGYRDELLDVGEPFALWVIEADDAVRTELPFEKAGLPVVFARDLAPYRRRKVRILNGAHTSFVPAAVLAGEKIVRDCMFHPVIRPFINACIYEEILPTLQGTLEQTQLRAFADSVCERFENPFIDHALSSICLNSVSKWKNRVLPTVLDAVKTGKRYHCLALSFAALCRLYAGGYSVCDDASVVEFFAQYGKNNDILERFAENISFWEMDLTQLPGFVLLAKQYFDMIRTHGALAAMEAAVKEG